MFEGKDQPQPVSEPKPGAAGIGKAAKIAIFMVLAIVVVAVVMLKKSGSDSTTAGGPVGPGVAGQSAMQTNGLPRFIEIGSVTCIPCKMMKPILDELRQEYAGGLQVDFIDVQVDRAAAMSYGIRVIPTQVFLDASGKELFRHEGFFPKEEILAKWKELGVNLQAAGQKDKK